MRITISGSHATGKTTLITELALRLPGYAVVEEPYYALAGEEHHFATASSAEDFGVLLERSLAGLTGPLPADVLLDRGPADYLAYLAALRPASGSMAHWVARAKEAMARLDLVVFVPIERPDRVTIDVTEGRRLRRRVDETLREMLIEDAWGFGAHVIEVSGTTDARARHVLASLAECSPPSEYSPGPAHGAV